MFGNVDPKGVFSRTTQVTCSFCPQTQALVSDLRYHSRIATESINSLRVRQSRLLIGEKKFSLGVTQPFHSGVTIALPLVILESVKNLIYTVEKPEFAIRCVR
jgi:hypothetical protein